MVEPSERPGELLIGDAARQYVRRWAETGRVLEQLRWQELSTIDDARALRASDRLLEWGRRFPIDVERREWSGLVEQQRLFQRMARR